MRAAVVAAALAAPASAQHWACNVTERLGCYEDLKHGPTPLPTKAGGRDDRMTHAYCASQCKDLGFGEAAFYGVESGNMCHCGDALNAGAKLVPDAKCDEPCAGDAGEMCGAAYHLDVFHAACPKPAPPTPQPPPTPAPTPFPPTPAPTPHPPIGKPVQVYILMGQSNMLGEGKINGDTNGTLEFAVKTEHKYPYLWDEATWSVSNTVRDVAVMGSGGPTSPVSVHHNEYMTVGGGSKNTIGPEFGIGFTLGNYTTDPVMTLKSCIGNRALGWDLLPPGSESFDYADPKNASKVWTYAGYHQSPSKWEKGTTPVPISWMAGIQYDGDTTRASNVLADLSTYYPGATSYEVAGFFWWQGDRDSRDMALAGRYEQNLVKLIKTLRTQYKAPNAKFVTASLGQTVKGSTDGGGLILDAMLNVDGTSGKYPEFKGNVAAVYTHPLVHGGGSSGSHYGGDAETYMNIGEAMGAAMVGLLKGE